jgi:hypothetical protein
MPPRESIVHTNPAISFNKVWPATRFAKSRIARLKTRAVYDTISSPTKKGAITNGIPLGTKNPSAFILCIFIAITFIPIKIVSDIPKVTKKWLVIVKLYGIIPTKLLKIRNENRKKIKGKNFTPSLPIVFSTISLVNKYNSSIRDCQRVGTIFVFSLMKCRATRSKIKTILKNKLEFVKAK